MKPHARNLGAAFVVAAAFGAATTQAADDDPQVRTLRVQFAEGQAFESAGRWADALDRFEAVARARQTPQVEFHEGMCLEHLGRLVSAQRFFTSARDHARGVAPEVVSESESHLGDLGARIPKVYVSIAGESRGVSMFLDGAPLDANTIARVDPGPHVATAVRDGWTVAASAFSVFERRSKMVALTVYPLKEPPSSARSPIARATPVR